MVLPAVRQQILEDLDRLSPHKQREAADLVHNFVTTSEANEPLGENPEWKSRGYEPPRHPLRVTPTPQGSGHADTALKHDEVLANRS
jgi:hypothetical protein